MTRPTREALNNADESVREYIDTLEGLILKIEELAKLGVSVNGSKRANLGTIILRYIAVSRLVD